MPLAPEIGWLLALCRDANTPPPVGLDERVVLDATRYHRLTTQLGHSLSRLLPSPEGRERAGRLYKRQLGLNLARASLAVRVMTAFSDADIPALLFKGPAFAAALGQNPIVRSGRDLDILVNASDLERAGTVLRGFGFVPEQGTEGVSAWWATWYLKNLPETSDLFALNNVGIIELHTRLTHHPLIVPVSTPQLLEQPPTIALGGHRIPTLPLPLALNYAAFHGFNHAWARLFWVKDFADALTAPDGTVDWQACWREAEQMHLMHFLGHAVALGHALIGGAKPEGPLQHPRYSKSVPIFFPAWSLPLPVSEETQFGRHIRRIGRIRYIWLAIRLHGGFGQRFLPLLEFMRPTADDFAFISLPKPLHALGWLVRPIRLLLQRRWRVKD